MNKKWCLYFSSLLLSFGFVSAQKGPFSFFGGGGSGGLIGSFERGVNALVGLIGRNPAIPVFFMVFSIIYYLSRKTVFKEESGRNPAMIFSLAVAGIGLIPTFGLVTFISEAIGGGFLGLMALSALFFWGWTWINNLRADNLESSAKKARSGKEAIAAGRDRSKDVHGRWEDEREREVKREDVEEGMGTSQRLRELRHFLRTEISNSLRYVGNLDNQICGGATNLDFSDLQESLNRIYNSMHQLFPGEVIEFKN